MRRFLVIGLSVMLSACGAKYKLMTGAPFSKEEGKGGDTGKVSCIVDVPQLVLEGHVNGFEMKSGFGIQIGYDRSGSYGNVGGTVKLKIEKAQMDLTFLGLDPLSGEFLAATDVGSDQTSTNIGAQVDFNMIRVNPGYFFQTPMGKVTYKGLERAVTEIEKQMDQRPWMGRALKQVDENTVVINAGSLAGVREGDMFEVFNVVHDWSGAPCASTHIGSRRTNRSPDAVVQVVSVGMGSSYAYIIQSDGHEVEPGAEVDIVSLVTDNPNEVRSLKKKVRLSKVLARKFPLPGGGTFDMEEAMNNQILDVLVKSKFVLMK